MSTQALPASGLQAWAQETRASAVRLLRNPLTAVGVAVTPCW